MLKLVAITAAALVLTSPAPAQTAPQPQQPSTASKAKDPNRIICERQEVLGSRLGGAKVCKTAAEWDAERQANREALDSWQRQPGAGVPSN